MVDLIENLRYSQDFSYSDKGNLGMSFTCVRKGNGNRYDISLDKEIIITREVGTTSLILPKFVISLREDRFTYEE